jgi:predicted MFS family arabinose efflux permease
VLDGPLSCSLAGGADAPVGRFGLVDDEAVGVARFQARSRAGCAVDVRDIVTCSATTWWLSPTGASNRAADPAGSIRRTNAASARHRTSFTVWLKTEPRRARTSAVKVSRSTCGWAFTAVSTATPGRVTRKATSARSFGVLRPVVRCENLNVVPLSPYRRVLSVPAMRQALALGILVRIPIFAGGVLLTLHVVQTLHRSYGAAGLVTAAATICIAVSGPWRGKLLDTKGLRRVVLPSLVVTAICWSIAPFVGYLPLLMLAALAGLFVVPTFSIIRQAVMAAVPDSDRRTALSLDAVAVEVAFMVGPVVGVWAATIWPTSWVLFTVEMLGVLAGVGLWFADPVMHADRGDTDDEDAPLPRSAWFRPQFLAMCAAAAATTIVLSGCDIAFVAALRDFDKVALIGPVLALWGLGSVIGGLVYGILHRSISAFLLLGALSVATIPIALAPNVWPLAVLGFVAGLFCAPTITATVDQLSRVVPDAARGEAIGWHGSAMTAGSALGAPVAGLAIDRWGWGGGFVSVSLVGVAVALLGAGGTRSYRRSRKRAATRRAQPTEPASSVGA